MMALTPNPTPIQIRTNAARPRRPRPACRSSCRCSTRASASRGFTLGSSRSPGSSGSSAASRPKWSMSMTAAATTRLAVAQTLPAEALDVQVVSLSRNFGKEAALLAGLDHARLGAVLFMDGDGQHPPALIPTLVGHWLDGGYDVVFTAKAHRANEPRLRRFAVRMFYRMINWNTRRRFRRMPATSGCCRRAPPMRCAVARAQPLLQGAGELDRVQAVPRGLRAGRARAWHHQLEPLRADRPVDRRPDVVLGGAVAAREPARPAAGLDRAAVRRCRSCGRRCSKANRCRAIRRWWSG